MMRDVVKTTNEKKQDYFAHLSCGHVVLSPTPYHSLNHFNDRLWCEECHKAELNKNMRNMNAYDNSEPQPDRNQYNSSDNESIPMDSFQKLLYEVEQIHNKKKHDYSHPGDRYSNFNEAGLIASMFKNHTDIAFAVLIGVKLSRLSNLLNNNLIPNNESIDDTFLDLTTYCALWAAFHKDNK